METSLKQETSLEMETGLKQETSLEPKMTITIIIKKAKIKQ